MPRNPVRSGHTLIRIHVHGERAIEISCRSKPKFDGDQSLSRQNLQEGDMRFFALNGSEEIGGAVARALSIKLDPHEERDFEDGEHKTRPLVSVRGADVYVLHSLGSAGGASVNDRLCKLLFFLATCRENGAARVTAIVPYLAYARKDRQTKMRDPVTTRYVAQLFEAVGTDRIVTLDVHNFAAFQNAFRCESIHLDTRNLFVPIIRVLAEDRPITIFSPDGGGMKRVQLLKEALEADTRNDVGFGFMEKRRSRGVVSGDLFAGDVAGTAVFIVDDMISTRWDHAARSARLPRTRSESRVYDRNARAIRQRRRCAVRKPGDRPHDRNRQRRLRGARQGRSPVGAAGSSVDWSVDRRGRQTAPFERFDIRSARDAGLRHS